MTVSASPRRNRDRGRWSKSSIRDTERSFTQSYTQKGERSAYSRDTRTEREREREGTVLGTRKVKKKKAFGCCCFCQRESYV